jgi:hypothetical protein
MKNWKRFGRERSCCNSKVLSRHSPGGTEENYEKLSQDNLFPCRDLNCGTAEYETGAFHTSNC